MVDKPLDPPDRERCQGEWTKATPFRLGGPMKTRIRCDKVPLVIATEKRPGEDGQVGSMSLCGACKFEFERQFGHDFATYEALPVQNFP